MDFKIEIQVNEDEGVYQDYFCYIFSVPSTESTSFTDSNDELEEKNKNKDCSIHISTRSKKRNHVLS